MILYKMSASSSTMLSYFSLLVALVLLIPCTTCFEITKLLSQYPSYSTFSNYLTQTKLADELNNRETVTLLAVDNAGLAPISGEPMDVIKRVLSLHVILDYFDVEKFHNMGDQTITVATLFQTTGQAQGMQGFMKITDLSTGSVTFNSISDPNAAGAKLIKDVFSQPYNISIVQVSTVIMPRALLDGASSPSPVPVATPIPVPMPVVSPVPVATPVPVPVPVVTPVPVVSPVPVAVPIPVPAPALSPPSPAPGSVSGPGPNAGDDGSEATADSSLSPGGGADNEGEDPNSNSGVNKLCVNTALATLVTFLSVYVMYNNNNKNIDD